MSTQDEALEAYLKKLLEHDLGLDEQSLPVLTAKQLKEIALNSGMTNKEYEDFLNASETYYTNGKKHLALFNYNDAQEAFQQCLSRQPIHLKATFGLAETYHRLGLIHANETYFKECDKFISRCLKLEPSYGPALELAATKARDFKSLQRNSTKKKRKFYIAAAIAIILTGCSIAYLNNTIIELEEHVQSTQAQLESVYQRQDDLLPKIEVLAEIQHAGFKNKLKEVEHLQKTIQKNSSEHYYDDRDKLAVELQQLGYYLKGDLGNENAQVLFDEIEGSINRIHIERRNHNQAVKQYNNKIQKFPFVLFGYSKRDYIMNKNM